MGLIKTSEQITLPDDADQWLQFRQLTKRQLDAAFDVAREASAGWRRQLMDGIKATGGDPMAELEKARQKAMASGAEIEEPDPLTVYDACAVVDAGIIASSYGEALGDRPSDALEPSTVEWAARQILGMSARPPQKSPDTSGS